MNATFISDQIDDNVDQIKLAVLLYEKVVIPKKLVLVQHLKTNKYLAVNLYGFQNFSNDVRPFDEEGLIVQKQVVSTSEYKHGIQIEPPYKTLGNQVIAENINLFFKEKIKLRGAERANMEIGGELVDEADKIDTLLHEPFGTTEIVFNYYINKLNSLVEGLSEGNACINSGYIIDQLFRKLNSLPEFKEIVRKIEFEKNIKPLLTFDAFNISLPNLTKLSSYDVLEVRLKAKDELEALKIHISKFVDKTLEQLKDQKDLQALRNEYQSKVIIPTLKDVTDKLNGMKLKVGKSVFNTTAFGSVPLYFTLSDLMTKTQALLVAGGLTTLSAALEYYEQHKELKNNGLYLLYKFNEKISR